MQDSGIKMKELFIGKISFYKLIINDILYHKVNHPIFHHSVYGTKQ